MISTTFVPVFLIVNTQSMLSVAGGFVCLFSVQKPVVSALHALLSIWLFRKVQCKRVTFSSVRELNNKKD